MTSIIHFDLKNCPLFFKFRYFRLKSHFWQEIITLTRTIRKGIKFATQIPPLLNLIYFRTLTTTSSKMWKTSKTSLNLMTSQKQMTTFMKKIQWRDDAEVSFCQKFEFRFNFYNPHIFGLQVTIVCPGGGGVY